MQKFVPIFFAALVGCAASTPAISPISSDRIASERAAVQQQLKDAQALQERLPMLIQQYLGALQMLDNLSRPAPPQKAASGE